MKTKNSLSLLFFLFLICCQKDYYLGELNEVNNKINTLNSQIEKSQNEMTPLEREKKEIENQILEIKIALQEQQISIDQALIKLDELENKIIEIEGIKDGIYEAVMSKTLSSITNDQESDKPWLVSDPETSRYIEVKDKKIISYATEMHFQIEQKSDPRHDIYLDTRIKKSSPFYTDLTKIDTSELNPNPLYYFINLSKKRTSLDTLLFIDETTYKYFDEEKELKKEIRKIYTKYVERDFMSYTSESELINLFKETKRGFFSDTLYQTLDASDPYDYIRVFIADAKRHGVDLSHITNKEPYLHLVDLDFDPCAYASDLCDREKIWIEFDINCWNNVIPEPYYFGRLATMYHELGHTILSYQHPEVNNKVVGGFNDRRDDIMGYGTKSSWNTRYDPEQTWYKRLDRFFKGTDHVIYDC